MKIVCMYVNKPKKEEPVNYKEIGEKVVAHFYRNKKLYVAAYLVTVTTIAAPGSVFAATTSSVGGIRLIKLMQAASFWIGLGVSIWGVVEAQLDYPGWKGRVLKGVLGYIAILLLPLIFIELRDSLQVDVWNQLGGKE